MYTSVISLPGHVALSNCSCARRCQGVDVTTRRAERTKTLIGQRDRLKLWFRWLHTNTPLSVHPAVNHSLPELL